MTAKTILTLCTALALYCGTAAAQGDSTIWDLDRCIRYALEHSNEILTKTNEVEGAEIRFNSAKMSRMPELSASIGGNAYFGRSPSRDGSYIDNSQLSASFGISTSIALYQGLRIKHETDAARVDLEAATHNLSLARESIALSITSCYLQALYAMETMTTSQNQLSLSRNMLTRAQSQYESGKVSKSEVTRNEAEVASDKASAVKSRNDYMLAMLDLRQTMNLPDSVSLEISQPTEEIPQYRILPDVNEICAEAMMCHPSVKAAEASLLSNKAALKSAKSQYQPSMYMNAGYGNSIYNNLTDKSLNSDIGSQLTRNGNEYVGISLSIPIYSRNATRNAVKLSTLNVENSEYTLDETKKKLRKEIETAYWGAIAAYETMLANEKSLASAKLVLDNEIVSMESGKSDAYSYAEAKIRWENAQAAFTHSKYDYLLKLRILDFYIVK